MRSIFYLKNDKLSSFEIVNVFRVTTVCINVCPSSPSAIWIMHFKDVVLHIKYMFWLQFSTKTRKNQCIIYASLIESIYVKLEVVGPLQQSLHIYTIFMLFDALTALMNADCISSFLQWCNTYSFFNASYFFLPNNNVAKEKSPGFSILSYLHSFLRPPKLYIRWYNILVLKVNIELRQATLVRP